MNTTKKKSHINRANRTRIISSDFDRIGEIQNILSELGYHGLRNEVLHHPSFIHRERHPDLIIKIKGEVIPIELDGPIHGGFDELTESEQTRDRNDDYFKAGYYPVILNEEWLEVTKTDKKIYLKSILINLESLIRSKKRSLGLR